MEDVSEECEWISNRTRSSREAAGYTTFSNGDVLFAKITPCMENGKGAIVDRLIGGHGFGSTEFHVLRARPGVAKEYIAQWMQSRTLRLKAEAFMTGSAGQRRVPSEFFSRFEVPVFSLREQRRIGEILNTVDDTIRSTVRFIAKLEDMKKGLRHDLLSRGLNENGVVRPKASERSDLYRDTRVGQVPREWDVGLLDSFATRGSGHTPNKNVPSYWDGGIRWVSLADSERLDNVWIQETDKEISELGIANSSAVKHVDGTVILSRDAGVGKSAILVGTMAVSQHFMAWTCGARLNNVYLYYWLQHAKPRFEAIAMGSTIKTIGLPYFKGLEIAVPSRREQDAAADFLLDSDRLIWKAEAERDKLRAVKAGLMEDLLTGRVRATTSEDAA